MTIGVLPAKPQINAQTDIWGFKSWFEKVQNWIKGASDTNPIILAASFNVDADSTYLLYPVDTTSGSVIASLPPAAGTKGKAYVFKKIVAANTLTVTAYGSDTIDGAATFALTAQWGAVYLLSDGVSKWNVISQYPSGGSSTGALVKIAQVVTTGSAAQITFSSIPATYDNLMIIMMGRDTSTVAASLPVKMRMNADATAANYQSQLVDGANTTPAAAVGSTSVAGAEICFIPGTLGPFPTAIGSAEIILPYYAGTTFQKTAFTKSMELYNATAAGMVAIQHAYLWKSTAAINQIIFTSGGVAFVNGTTATLYGF